MEASVSPTQVVKTTPLLIWISGMLHEYARGTLLGESVITDFQGSSLLGGEQQLASMLVGTSRLVLTDLSGSRISDW